MIHVKTDKEIELMRAPCKITGDVLKLLEEKIKPGMTTKELDRIAYDYIVSCGAKPSFLGLYGFPETMPVQRFRPCQRRLVLCQAQLGYGGDRTG